jgi:hypothetical protein
MPEDHELVGARSGRDKEPEADDPMLGVMVSLPGGDPKLMATCIIEEYAMLGLTEDELVKLFSEPYYRTHQLYRAYGEAWVRDLIRDVLGRTGQFNCHIVDCGLQNEKFENPQSAICNPQSEEGGCDGESV